MLLDGELKDAIDKSEEVERPDSTIQSLNYAQSINKIRKTPEIVLIWRIKIIIISYLLSHLIQYIHTIPISQEKYYNSKGRPFTALGYYSNQQVSYWYVKCPFYIFNYWWIYFFHLNVWFWTKSGKEKE